ncbi:hypothetical protein [Arthrobacter sp. UNC362MFTsu5.1]|uniref:hypothetical protein n=1 Tax=Arthrobacter sp. UNC362MFTsu5.1 TaxID=1449044 RepID=UPI00048463E0|nr:hypothetical protein [Arthrobacter sp. UNC362MFTsu5.1]
MDHVGELQRIQPLILQGLDVGRSEPRGVCASAAAAAATAFQRAPRSAEVPSSRSRWTSSCRSV